MTCPEGCYCETMAYDGDGWDVFAPFSAEPHVFFLDSAQHATNLGRYSFIGYDPFKVFTSHSPSALMELRGQWAAFHGMLPVTPWPFVSGLVGYVAYDHALAMSGTHSPKPLSACPDVYFGFYDLVIVIDHLKREVTFFSSGLPFAENDRRKQHARDRVMTAMEKWRNHKVPPVSAPFKATPEGIDPVCHGFDQEGYCAMVARAQEYITAGEIYQVNLAQRLEFPLGVHIDTVKMYGALRRASDSCFSAYLDAGKFRVLSGSLERFLKVRDGMVETRPMKGTRPRGGSEAVDARFKNELIMSEKEKAELLMITDLMRNDLGRICAYGSVTVADLRVIEAYPTVYQATSTVRGVLRSGLSPFDVLTAAFPPGSVTGCPKIRALSIIEELEDFRRGLYCGTLGYIGFDGNMDMNVIIRTAVVEDGKCSFCAGSGIVADSIPENEFAEILVKARALVSAWPFVAAGTKAES